jgi:hypothetical protein
VTDETTIRRKLAEVCEKRGGKAAIALAFNVHPTTVKRWLEGGEIPPPMCRLLDWYLFGVVPPRLASSVGLQGTLEFTDAEWRIVRVLAARAGQTPEKWIASTIRVHLDLFRQGTEPQTRGLRVAEEERGNGTRT